ncbi:Dabb family protein [Noviherbaspirillum saxi]|uniref:Dabb family protein n=1 Tax=Noviherbaspirillum saxi TaxID=2320863 RepID=A0A3A3FZR9_9BURK|nr:Dabb family protein [Noviherbaspirillum saxi]RJF92569.1 Dabb family protein [Noviherbaspirillum saxi]
MPETAQLYLDEGADRAAFEAALKTLPGGHAANLPGCWGAGEYTWDSASAVSARASLESLPGVSRVDAVRYTPIGGGLHDPDLAQGVKRTLLLRVWPRTDTARIERFEQELLQMPHYMGGIRNWSLGRCEPGSAWTHVWQQEFADVAALFGEYLMHPYHWAWVDRWFDSEHPERIVDGALSHAFCPMAGPVLASLT